MAGNRPSSIFTIAYCKANQLHLSTTLHGTNKVSADRRPRRGDNGVLCLRCRPLRGLLLIDYRFIESTSAYSSSMLPAVFTFPRSFAESGYPSVYQAMCFRISRTVVNSPLY